MAMIQLIAEILHLTYRALVLIVLVIELARKHNRRR